VALEFVRWIHEEVTGVVVTRYQTTTGEIMCAVVACIVSLGNLRVEPGKSTSNVIPASRKRRRKGNPLVSDETVIYGYESSATLTTDRLRYNSQTCPVVREGAPRRRA
jgi:hypothetical protein